MCKLTADAPSTYLKWLWFDTCVFSADLVKVLVGVAGADRLMMGSDYPFDVGDQDPVGLIRATELSDADKQKLLFGKASRLFGIA